MTYALKKQGYTDELIKMFSKGVFPYEYLQETSLPQKSIFYSTLTSSNISVEVNMYAHAVFREGKYKKVKIIWNYK